MDGPPTWQSSLTFSDRVASILKITESYRSAFPEIYLPEAQAEGRSIEKEIYRKASSKADYNGLINAKIDSLEHIKTLNTTQKSNAIPEIPILEHVPGQGQQIGPFSNAIYHERGLFSTIYKAQSSSSGLLALKVTKLSQATPPHNPRRESRILKHAAHSSIIPLLSACLLADGLYLLVFPFLPLDLGTLLQNHIDHSSAAKKATYLLRDLFSALGHLHSLGIIHRDLKPSNILLASPTGPAYLADFGIAWMPGDEASEPAGEKITDVGTTSYRPPELLFGHSAYGCSLDLWAAGCVVAEMFLEGGETLFDSGALGSELALIQSIFKTLGTPTLETWPEAAQFSAWGKMEFLAYPRKPWAEILPLASEAARDLVSRLVRYESTARLDAGLVLEHAFFQESTLEN